MSDSGKHGDGGHGKRHRAHGGGHGGGGGHEEAHEGAPEWLISFADMVMLMMGFFVILFALNVQPKGGNPGGGGTESEGVANEPDMIDFAIAVRRAFHNDVDLNSEDPRDQPLIQRILERQQGAGEARDDGTRGNDRNVQSVRPANFFGKGTTVRFGHRSTSLDDAAAATVRDFAAKHRGMNTVLEVQGHAGVGEAPGARGPSGGESDRSHDDAMVLSFERAMATARALVEAGIEWRRLRIKAAGDADRVEAFPGDHEADAKNARVEITVSDDVAQPSVPVGPFGAETGG